MPSGPAGRPPARANRLLDHRQQSHRPLYAARLSRRSGQHPSELARQLGLDSERFTQTIADYNAACAPGQFDHTRTDNCATAGLTPPKTHWARPIDTPPYYGYALRPGITFTYLGLYVDDTAAVHFAGKPAATCLSPGK